MNPHILFTEEAGTLDCELSLDGKLIFEATRYVKPLSLCVQWRSDPAQTALHVADQFTKLYGTFGDADFEEERVLVFEPGNGEGRRCTSESGLLRALMFSSAPVVVAPELSFIMSNSKHPTLTVITPTNIAPELGEFVQETSLYHPPKELIRDIFNALYEGTHNLYRW